MLECQHVVKTYKKKTVIEDCSFQLKKGEVLGIMGESGSGKSTLAKLIVGIEPVSKGSILLDGKTYDVKKDGVRMQLVFQDALNAVNPNFSVREILSEGLKGAAEQELVDMLEAVGLDARYLDYKARQISGGQLQRVCIARALLLKPDILIFDEALSGLDPVVQEQMLRLLYTLKERYDLTYIFISHEFSACYALCHRILVMFEGKIVEEVTDFSLPMQVTSPVTEQLIKQAGDYSKCQLRRALNNEK